MERLLPLIVTVPLLGAALLVAGGRRLRRVAADSLGWLCSAASAALAVAGLVLVRGRGVEWVGGWSPHGGHSVGIVLVGDRTGLGLAALTSLLVTAVLAYSWRYFREPPRRHAGAFPALVLLFQAGMCGFALTGDLFDAFVFFELMGVVAYALTGYRVEEKEAVQGALTFGVLGSLGGYASLLGIGLLYARTGELGMAQAGRALDAAPHRDALVIASMVLIMTGLLVKAAAVPFHFWLPDAHAVAPTPVCMLLSGVMVEMGVYGTARVYHTVFAGPGGVPADGFRHALLTLAVATALVGAVMCWQQRHLKRMLAFSTVGHTGLFLTGVALLGPQGFAGSALYVLGHAGAKAALFACAGLLLDHRGSVDEVELYGRGRDLPVTGVVYALGGLALAGLPPFGTGLGKTVGEEAAARLGWWLPAVFVIVSALTGAAVLRGAARIFLGLGEHPEEGRRDPEPETTGKREEPETEGRIHRPPLPMLVVALVLLAASLAVGLVPALADAVAGAAAQFTDHAGYAAAVLDGRSGRSAVPAARPEVSWTADGVALGVLSSVLAVGLAAAAVLRPRTAAAAVRWAGALRRLHSGHVGDYVAWAAAGIGLLAVLTVW